MKTRTLYPVMALFAIASLILSACAMANAAPSTSTPAPTNTPAATATITPTPTKTPKPTMTPNATATQRAGDFLTKIQEYSNAGYISTSKGSYIYLDNFSDSQAKMNYFFWHTLPFSPDNFIITSDITWVSASAAADSSGCGYVFRVQSNSDNYMMYLSLKGYVEAATFISNRWKSMGRATFGQASQHGKAKLTLIAEGNKFHVLVNDKLIKVYTGLQGKLTSGDLAYTVLSGTNKSFGTSCTFDNLELWTIGG